MEIKREYWLYAGGAAIAILIIVALSRKGGGGPITAITGPSESTTREMLHTQVELADIYTNAETERFRIESGQFVETTRIAAGERVAIQEIASRSTLAKILIEPDLIRARAVAEKEQHDFFSTIFHEIFGFLGL